MTEGLWRRCYPHTALAIILCFDNPTVLFAICSQSTSPSEEVEAYTTLSQGGPSSLKIETRILAAGGGRLVGAGNYIALAWVLCRMRRVLRTDFVRRGGRVMCSAVIETRCDLKLGCNFIGQNPLRHRVAAPNTPSFVHSNRKKRVQRTRFSL